MDVGTVAVRHEPASAALVRQAIATDLQAHAVSRNSIEDVMLVASELVGNAVIHASTAPNGDPDLDIAWEIGTAHVTVVVADGSTTLPLRRTSARTETNGRGLAIVAALCSDWGVDPIPNGKRVWARVRIAAI